MMPQPEFQRRLASIDELIRKVELTADPDLRTTAQVLVQLVMDLHGSGLERILELIRSTDDSLIQKLGRDDLVSSLLVLHGLHPLDVETRLRQAVDTARSRIRSHGADVELLGIEEGAVRLRLQNGHGCGSGQVREIVEEAIYQAAPDVTSLHIEDAAAKQSFVPLDMLLNGVAVGAGGKGGL